MTPTDYVVYQSATGRIIKAVSCSPEMIEEQLDVGESYLAATIRSDGFYVDPHEKRILSQQDYSLDALPMPCTLTIEGAQYRCTSQPVLTFDIPGVYQISVDAGPRYMEKVFSYAYTPSKP